MLTKEQMHSIVGELWVENSPKIFEFLTKYADTKDKQDACLQTIRDRQAVNRTRSACGPTRRPACSHLHSMVDSSGRSRA